MTNATNVKTWLENVDGWVDFLSEQLMVPRREVADLDFDVFLTIVLMVARYQR